MTLLHYYNIAQSCACVIHLPTPRRDKMTLANLPDELRLMIARHVGTQHELLNLAKTNKTFCAFVLPMLYRLNATGDVDGRVNSAPEQSEEGNEPESEGNGIQNESDASVTGGEDTNNANAANGLATVSDDDDASNAGSDNDDVGEQYNDDETGDEYDDESSESDETVTSIGIIGDAEGEAELEKLDHIALYWAVQQKQLGTIHNAHAAGVSLDDSRLVRLAVAAGYLPIVEHLLSLHPNHLSDPFGGRLVEVACYNRHLDVVKKLFQLGAAISSCARRVLVATLNGNSNCELARELVALLVANGVDVEAKDEEGATPLIEFLNNNTTHAHAISALLDNGASPAIKSADGRLPLIQAIQLSSGCLESIKLLLSHGADPNQCDETGTPPLVIAARLAPFQVIQLVVRHGANIACKDNLGCTPLLAVASRGGREAVQLFLDKGAPADEVAPCGCTPLAHACEDGEKETVKLLLGQRPDVLRVNNAGKTALHVVVGANRDTWSALNAVLEHGEAVTGQAGNGEEEDVRAAWRAWLNKRDHFGRTALFYAARTGDVSVVITLIKAGAAVDIKDRFGASPIFAAARTGQTRVVQALLDAQPSLIDETDVFGRKLMDWALECGPTSLVQAVNSYHGEPIITKMPDWFPGPMWHSFQAKVPSCDICKRELGQNATCWTCRACSKLTTIGVYQVCRQCVERADAAGIATCLEPSHAYEGVMKRAECAIRSCYVTSNVYRQRSQSYNQA